ncbi:ComF operon protein 3 [Listeria monocytogenes FSL J1-208]|uniref:ComF family protein n=1 Tax=Listeria monocytogenes TaxID=1639 RepID=UPI0002548A36|nr:ComF family protein [Listeria monocytogenes]EAC7886158.1 ComF family protein [Listeria monocytogenes]EAE0012472.1 ComF family protein [Listeria monocytogenes]EAE5923071.1 ComF family protein [Listeria monocytogenes]EAF5832999.1 ComF family protein [Listeria monocytogenes]EAG6688532.1 ComF family protein [Listeria monocytogenes]
MINCLLCFQPIKQGASWEINWLFKQASICCDECLAGFEKLIGPLCTICSKESSDSICEDCENRTHFLDSNISIYRYNDFAKEYMKKFKFQGDYEIGAIFKKDLSDFLADKKEKIVPIPVSKTRKLERGFNQTTAMLKQSGIIYEELLAKKHTEKQSKKTKKERLASEQAFYFSGERDCELTEVILFDDIYTTGSTLNRAAQILKESGANKVSALTIFR